ncbi:biotin carboxylase N-terminal domain-containing protein [Streptomyces sp. B6B3]|uniref:acetyl/propionyl/methylcrotonyl-CoA carboxylase subunit alpha n=1 Tax=Streptomyces sp. B6B3 TaxID=3153570 RepID=UPI00325D2E6E
MFDTVLVANRGEIAVRVIRTLRRLGVASVAVYSDADADARHVREADAAVRIGPTPAAESYLSAERLLAAAARSAAQAVHPGYGFLAENAAFARAVTAAGLAFVGPPAEAIEAMGDKIRAKRIVAEHAVPVVPGTQDAEADLTAEGARALGFPLLLKPSAGGGGKGMRLVRDPAELTEQIAGARREAAAAFGDATLLAERWIDRPRHVEVQVLADGAGTVLRLGERECSLQRRHQKIVEEAPSPLLDDETREAMGRAAERAARACGYRGAGTVEFIVPGDDPGTFYFMEMNTRLQVEHPVTELTTDLDLVEWQLRIAAGEPLPFGQDAVRHRGHAVEARIYAENPRVDFLPSSGTVRLLREPVGEGVRVDSGLVEGAEVGTAYDPMLAKVIAHGPDRATALRRLRAALARTTVLGLDTNVGFLRRLLAHPDVAAGDLDTGLIEREAAALAEPAVPDEVYAAVALLRQHALAPRTAPGGWTDPFAVPSGWRLGGEPAWTTSELRVPGGDAVTVRVRTGEVRVGDAEPAPARLLDPATAAESGTIRVEHAGATHTFQHAAVPGGHWLGRDGEAWHVREHDPIAAAGTGPTAAGDALTAPMPGTVTVVKAAVGDRVTAGQSLVVVEAMKMEHVVTAPHDGTVTELTVTAGAVVAMDQVLAQVAPDSPDTPDAPEEEPR